MASLLRAELLRSVSGRVLALLLLIAFLLNSLSIVGNSGTAVDALRAGQLTLTEVSHDLVRLGFGALLFSSLFGALLTTSEFRHGSIARSLFMAGRPERLIVAKSVVALVTGIAFGLAAVGSAVVASAIVLDLRGAELVFDRESALIVIGVFAVTVLSTLWGMLIGWLVRSQTAALAGILVWTLIVESAIIALAPEVGRFLPGGAQASIYRDFGTGDPLATPWGYAVFVGWIALAAAASIAAVRRRDLA
jgi:ABC-2 type transport system permease protein